MVRLSSAVGSQQSIGNAALMQRADDVLRMRIETTIRSLFSQVPSLLSCSQSRKDKDEQKGGPSWKPDDSVDRCEGCGIEFSMFLRRHHCRFCGGIFCRICSEGQQFIVNFGYTEPVRVCQKCNTIISRCQEFADAVFRNESGVVRKMLAEKKYSVNTYTGLYPPLYTCCKYGHVKMAKLLISAGAKVHFGLPASTPLGYECPACLRTSATSKEDALSKEDGVFLCLNCNKTSVVTDRDSLDLTGMTAIHVAVRKPENEATIRLLLQHRAEPNATTKHGETPLLIAAKWGQTANSRTLIDGGADVNFVSTKDGDTPLHRAVKGGHEGMIRLLLEYGADMSIKNKDDKTPKECSTSEDVLSFLVAPSVVKSAGGQKEYKVTEEEYELIKKAKEEEANKKKSEIEAQKAAAEAQKLAQLRMQQHSEDVTNSLVEVLTSIHERIQGSSERTLDMFVRLANKDGQTKYGKDEIRGCLQGPTEDTAIPIGGFLNVFQASVDLNDTAADFEPVLRQFNDELVLLDSVGSNNE
jgi:hypothetical protein